MPSVPYLLESAFGLACLYGLYRLLLRRETFFQWNRAYLLLAPLLACTVPALHIRVEQSPPPAEVSANPAVPPAAIDLPVLVQQAQSAPQAVRRGLQMPLAGKAYTLGDVLWRVYLAGVAFCLLQLVVQVGRLLWFIRRSRRARYAGLTLASGSQGLPPASFFGFVFLNPDERRGPEGRLLLRHELVHVRQWHSLDLILLELLRAFQWFNPLLYAYRRSLREIHEFIADEYVVRRTRQRYQYACLLARRQAAGNGAQPGLVNTFHSFIQNRLKMLAKHPSHPVRRAKYLFALPLFAGLLLLFSFRLVERLPQAKTLRDAVRSVETYAARLSEVTIVGQAALPEPTPYILYWGALQAKFVHLDGTDRYEAEVELSPEEFKEALKREPRLWTGQTLEQQLSLRVGNLDVRSDYYQPDVYATRKAALLELASQWPKDEPLVIDRISLPGGRQGRVVVSLGGKKPDWVIPFLQFPHMPPSKPDFNHLEWGGVKFQPAEFRFLTLEQFQNLMAATPTVFYDGNLPSKTPGKWNMAIYSAKGYDLRPTDSPGEGLSFDRLREQIAEQGNDVQPGVTVQLYAWDILEPAPGNVHIDTIFTVDLETQIQTMRLIRRNALNPLGNFSTDVITLRIVAPDDPRLYLHEDDKSTYGFEWGACSSGLRPRYGIVFVGADGRRISGDARSSQLETKFTRKDILDILRDTPRFTQRGILLDNFEFTLEFKGETAVVRDGVVPTDFLQKIERSLQPRDVLRIRGLQARTDSRRQIVCTPEQSNLLSQAIDPNAVRQVDVRYFGSAKLIRLIVSAAACEAAQKQLGEQPGIYFQTADVDLGEYTIELEVRSDDPKPPLHPAVGPAAAIGLQISPNPAREATTAYVSRAQAGEGTLRVVDAGGVVYFSKKMTLRAGTTPVEVPLNRLGAKGAFFVQVEMADGSRASAGVVVE